MTNPTYDEPLYFSIGAHPAFNVPVLPGTKKDDYFVRFEGKDELKYISLDPVAGNTLASIPSRRRRTRITRTCWHWTRAISP